MKQFSIPPLILSLVAAALSSSALADSTGSAIVSGTYVLLLSSRDQEFAIPFSPQINPTSLMEGNSSGHDFHFTRIPVANGHSDSPTVRNSVLFTFADGNSCKGFGDLWNFCGSPEGQGKEGHPILVPTGLFNGGSAFGHFGNNGTQGRDSSSGGGSGGIVATPEPSVLILLLCCLVTLALCVKFRG